jgi:hypothetical protein
MEWMVQCTIVCRVLLELHIVLAVCAVHGDELYEQVLFTLRVAGP